MTFNINDLNLLRDYVYADAAEHGFYSQQHSILHQKMWIVAEIGELANAQMKGRKMVDKGYKEDFAQWYCSNMKNTVEDELADVLIISASLAGYHEIDLDPVIQYVGKGLNPKLYELTLVEFCAVLAGTIMEGLEDKRFFMESIQFLMVGLLDYCYVHDLDIFRYVDYKTNYNNMRSYQHKGE